MCTVLFIYLFIYLLYIYLFIIIIYPLPRTQFSGKKKLCYAKKKVIVRTHRHTHTQQTNHYLDHTVTDNHPTRYRPVVAGKDYLLAKHDAVSEVRVNGSPV